MQTLDRDGQIRFASLAGSFGASLTRHPTTITKSERDFRSRQRHFLKFCNKYSLNPTFSNFQYDQEAKNYIMTLYTFTLCNHETILNKPIKTNTIELYHKAAISFPKTFNEITATTHKTIWNPLKDVNGKKPQTITDLLQEHKLWEDEISKRKPVTEEMFNYIQSLVNQQKPCSLISALADWATIARQAGLRLSEYCQDSRTIKPGNYALNVYGEAKAFTINDFIFVGHNNENLNPSHTDRLDISQIGGAYIRWRTQKKKWH